MIKFEVTPSTLTFDKTNWNTPQVVRVSSLHDSVDGSEEKFLVTHAIQTNTLSEADSIFKSVDDMTVVVTIADTDKAGIKLKSAVMTVKEGGGAVNGAVLGLESKPSENVTLSLTSFDCSPELVITPTTITFSPANWNVAAQSFTISARNGIRLDSCEITISASGAEYFSIEKTISVAIQKTIIIMKSTSMPSNVSVPFPIDDTTVKVMWENPPNMSRNTSCHILWVRDSEKRFDRVDVERGATLHDLSLPFNVWDHAIKTKVDCGSPSSTEVSPWNTTSRCGENEYLNNSRPIDGENPVDWTCKSCPTSVLSGQIAADCHSRSTLANLEPLQGFWRINQGRLDDPQGPLFQACLTAESCVGVGPDRDRPDRDQNVSLSNGTDVSTRNTCNQDLGYRNDCHNEEQGWERCRLCATCARGYARSLSVPGQCLECPDPQMNQTLLALGILGVLMICAILVFVTLNDENHKDNISDALKKM